MTHSKNTRSEEFVSHGTPAGVSYPCPEWEAKLVYMHPDDLPEMERMRLFKHLSQCSACATFRRRYRAVNEIIRDLPEKEEVPGLALPAKLVRLWEFEYMQGKLSPEDALLQQALLSEISEQVENKKIEEQNGIMQEFDQDKKTEVSAKKTRNWIIACFLFVVACLLSHIYRVTRFRKGGAAQCVVAEGTRSTSEKEHGVVTV